MDEGERYGIRDGKPIAVKEENLNRIVHQWRAIDQQTAHWLWSTEETISKETLVKQFMSYVMLYTPAVRPTTMSTYADKRPYLKILAPKVYRWINDESHVEINRAARAARAEGRFEEAMTNALLPGPRVPDQDDVLQEDEDSEHETVLMIDPHNHIKMDMDQ